MERKSYSDRRWYDAPMAITSQCCECIHWRGFGECEFYAPRIPMELTKKSFPGTRNYDEYYCQYREMRKK